MNGASLGRPRQSSLADLTGAFKARREHLRRYVKIVMFACVGIFFLAGARVAVGAIVGEDTAPRAREAMTRDVGGSRARVADATRYLAKANATAKTRNPRSGSGKGRKAGR